MKRGEVAWAEVLSPRPRGLNCLQKNPRESAVISRVLSGCSAESRALRREAERWLGRGCRGLTRRGGPGRQWWQRGEVAKHIWVPCRDRTVLTCWWFGLRVSNKRRNKDWFQVPGQQSQLGQCLRKATWEKSRLKTQRPFFDMLIFKWLWASLSKRSCQRAHWFGV